MDYASRNDTSLALPFYRHLSLYSNGIGFACASCMTTKMLLASIALSAIVLWAIGCGGSGGSGTPAPTGPSNTPAPQASTTVTIVSSAGSTAFNPNPIQVPSGGTIEWRNTTRDAHVLTWSDGRAIGTVPAGASVTTAAGGGGAFRCTNHPSMIGSVNGATVPDGPQGDPDYSYIR